MKNITSILGWLLLVAVLAIPSFLFYNWLSKSKQQNQAELVHEPISGSVFPSDKTSSQTPVAQQAAAPLPRQDVKTQEPKPGAPAKAAPAPAAEPAAAARQPAEQPPSASAKPPAEEPAPAQEPAVSTSAPQGTEKTGSPDQVAASTGPKLVSYYNPKSTRDPTFSPDDYKRIKDEQRRMEEAERAQQEAVTRVVKEPGPETRISLQGIVGNAAIVNGEMYSVGQSVRGIKILKIGADYIIAEYKGKKFRKVLK